MLYNIFRKVEVNPFENVERVVLGQDWSAGKDLIKPLFNSRDDITAVKIDGNWLLSAPLEILDFPVEIKLFSPVRGVFKTAKGSVHFTINGQYLRVF